MRLLLFTSALTLALSPGCAEEACPGCVNEGAGGSSSSEPVAVVASAGARMDDDVTTSFSGDEEISCSVASRASLSVVLQNRRGPCRSALVVARDQDGSEDRLSCLDGSAFGREDDACVCIGPWDETGRFVVSYLEGLPAIVVVSSEAVSVPATANGCSVVPASLTLVLPPLDPVDAGSEDAGDAGAPFTSTPEAGGVEADSGPSRDASEPSDAG